MRTPVSRAPRAVSTSDTGPTEEIWRRANAIPNLKGVFLETCFPNELDWLAKASKHHTAATFSAEVRKLQETVPVIVVHIKARFREQVIRELEALGFQQLTLAASDKISWTGGFGLVA